MNGKRPLMMQFTSLNINQTWEGTILFENQTTISSKWIFKVKIKISGTIDKLVWLTHYNEPMVPP
jgi:hypothetical protein